MSSISIFPCSFTPVESVVNDLSKELSLVIYNDDDLINETAERFGIKTEKLRSGMYEKTSVFNQFTLERERTVNLLSTVLADRLDDSRQYLFYGFLASLIPASVTHVLRVVIVDSKQGRVHYAVEEGGSTLKEAKKKIKHDDLIAYYWTDFLFHKEAYDSSLYDMVIPVEKKDSTMLVESVVRCFRTTSVLQNELSLHAVSDFKLETVVQDLLLTLGHKLTVKANKGKVTLIVEKNVLNYGRLVDELTGLVAPVSGVKEVVVERGSGFRESIYRQQKFELPSKVLFVDDEQEFVETVSQRLISRDVGTYGVYNGEDALDLIIQDRPDVMVLDLKMPGLYGVEVLRRTKEIAPEVEVIILTGHGTNEDMKQCMELGVFAYMNKPVDIDELSNTIKAANAKVRQTGSEVRAAV